MQQVYRGCQINDPEVPSLTTSDLLDVHYLTTLNCEIQLFADDVVTQLISSGLKIYSNPIESELYHLVCSSVYLGKNKIQEVFCGSIIKSDMSLKLRNRLNSFFSGKGDEGLETMLELVKNTQN